MPRTRVSSKGQVVIPKSVRDDLCWTEGTELEIETYQGQALMRSVAVAKQLPARSHLDNVRRRIKYSGPRLSFEDWDKALAGAARKDWSK